MYSFLKIAFRHLWQSRLYAAINIIGLATGITCMLLAMLFWKDEHSYDDFHQNNPHLYRITTRLVENRGARAETVGGTGQVQAPAFKQAVPAVQSYVRIMGGEIYGDVAANEKVLRLQTMFVDPNFFDVLSFKLLRGDPGKVLTDITGVVITETTARKFFNSIDAVGKRLEMKADPSFQKLGKPIIVTGVVEDPPKNSSIRFDALFAFKFLQLSFDDTNWLNAYLGSYVVLHPGADKTKVEQQFNQVYATHAREQLAEASKNYGYDPMVSYGLQPITEMHLNPLRSTNGNIENGVMNGSSPVYGYLFVGIALFILLMATINFVNISVAGSLNRSKEVGIRKIAGGSRLQIILQFLAESAFVCMLAFVLSLVFVNFSLPFFNRVTGKQLLLSDAADATGYAYFIVLLCLVVSLTGLYPAYILSNFKPSEVLYNKQKLSGPNFLGRSLVVVQFALTVFLLISAIVYYRQMNYIREKDLGYNPAQIIRTAVGGALDYKAVTSYLKNEFNKEPSIRMVSFGNDGWKENIEVNGKPIKAQYRNIDENFLALLEIPLRVGRNLTPSIPGDMKTGALVNETFIRQSGLQDPIGKSIKVYRDDSITKVIVGIVKDFHFSSLREPVAPLVMYMNEWPDGGIWIKFDKANQQKAIYALEKLYKKIMPDAVYEYQFLDEMNAREYMQEQRWQQVISIATLISFIICCLGLFGLAHLSTNQRVKEIGIRKVLGASVRQIVGLLSGEFLKLVGVAFVIAAPVAWIVMGNWLQDFAYRMEVGAGIFMAAGLLAVLMAFGAVSFQAIKAAVADPVKSLRSE